jgi:hypothetical protein
MCFKGKPGLEEYPVEGFVLLGKNSTGQVWLAGLTGLQGFSW